MKTNLPEYLYRGDSDDRNARLLKGTISHYQLQTNLINGGKGGKIIEEPLLELINKHVDIGWKHTHFLSFSENENIAIRYGINCDIEQVESKFEEYKEYYDSQQDWDFALITVDVGKISMYSIAPGIYEGFFKPILREFSNISKYRILLINVVDCLSGYKGYEKSRINAIRDKEWLILPATPKQMNVGIEYSAILDGGILSEIRKFKRK